MSAELSRLMANCNGPQPCKRKLLMSLVQSIMLYGAEVWADRLSTAYYRKRLSAVQRRGVLRVASAYRTFSEEAIMVVARVISIYLLAQERKAIHERTGENRWLIKMEARRDTLKKWQEELESCSKAAWTRVLIPRIEGWYNRKHGQVNFYLTQFLTGHGCFRKYLNTMRKVESPWYVYCKEVLDDERHTLFEF
ncbi:uncharacterized protein [Rhodnius prolixus]|uniref:uncharacterized protein n=1 Tax=Rhodnius prolixus TaxID=13249 RepID=UPI003D18B447